MIGIIIGAALTLGIINYGRLRHYRGRGGHHAHCSERGHWRERGPWSGRRGRGGSRRHARVWIDRLAERLDTTREQEQVLHDTASQLYDELETLGKEAKGTREGLGEVFGPDRFEEERMGELFATHDELLERARKAVTGALARIHEVLDPKQRETLAQLIARRRPFGPYRA